jgi:hypothetical protein
MAEDDRWQAAGLSQARDRLSGFGPAGGGKN